MLFLSFIYLLFYSIVFHFYYDFLLWTLKIWRFYNSGPRSKPFDGSDALLPCLQPSFKKKHNEEDAEADDDDEEEEDDDDDAGKRHFVVGPEKRRRIEKR